MNPDVDRGNCQKRIKAGGNPFPPHHQTPILLLKPGKRPLRLELRHHCFDWSAQVFLGFPDPLGELSPDTASPELLSQRFGILPSICGDDPETFTWAAPCAHVHLDGIK
jgi:hypothetical protein